MSSGERGSLPGSPPPVLQALWGSLHADVQEALRPHLLSDTSAEWIASTLTRYGHRVSASTIRTYRRALRQAGECNVD